MTSSSKLESDLEAKVRRYAISRGWWVAKFTSPGLRGVPDRIFIRNGIVIFIELKKPDSDEEPSRQQKKRHKEMRDHGAIVYWLKSLEEAHDILK